MFDYDGDINASLDDYQNLLAQLIREIFPTAKCTVLIRKTKAMQQPKISISILDGPHCGDMAGAIPMLIGVQTSARWAYCGKVLPTLGWTIRTHPKSTYIPHARAVWSQMQLEDSSLRNQSFPSKDRPYSHARHEERLSELLRSIHPARPSPTMALIARGIAENIVQIATEQRRDDLARSIAIEDAAPTAPVRLLTSHTERVGATSPKRL